MKSHLSLNLEVLVVLKIMQMVNGKLPHLLVKHQLRFIAALVVREIFSLVLRILLLGMLITQLTRDDTGTLPAGNAELPGNTDG